jgi:hypothetical protein
MLLPVLFFLANFCNLATKKKGLASPTKGFLKFNYYNDLRVLRILITSVKIYVVIIISF